MSTKVKSEPRLVKHQELLHRSTILPSKLPPPVQNQVKNTCVDEGLNFDTLYFRRADEQPYERDYIQFDLINRYNQRLDYCLQIMPGGSISFS
jgi:hypothetical protein